MALTPTLALDSESIDGEEMLIVYDDVTSYGGANYDRNEVATYITTEKINADTTSAYDVDIIAYTPSSATTYSFNITEDGWYKSKFVIIPNYDNATAYVIYDAVYEAGAVYRALGSTTGNVPPNASYWEIISEPTSLVDNDGTATESANIAFELKSDIIYPFSKQAYGDATAEASLECCSTCDRPEKVLDYEYIGILVDGMDVKNQRSQYSSGEKIARKASEVISE
jgi:hypothetical protein